MPSRWGLGPVFAVETLMNARRPAIYAGRSLFVLVLLSGLALVWAATVGGTNGGTASGSIQHLATVGEQFYYTLTMLQLGMVLLAAPAATAGSICLDRARGGLTHLLVTDLSDAEIVLGKLAARLAPVVGLLACGLPVTALATLLGGIDVGALTGAFVVNLAVALLGCSLAMTLSVWATKPHEVILAVFVAWIAAMLAYPIWEETASAWGLFSPPDWFEKLNPLALITAPYDQPGFVTVADYAIFVAVALAASALLNGLTIACLRRSMASDGRTARPRRSWGRWSRSLLPGPGLDGNPVLWREWHRSRPSRMARVVWVIFIAASLLGTSWGLFEADNGASRMGLNALMTVGGIQVVLGLLMASIAAPTALGEERVRGSLDLLLATPMSTRAIVLGKWLGAFRIVPWLAALPVVAAVVIAYEVPATSPPRISTFDRLMVPSLMAGQMLADGAAITSLGLALSTWMSRPGRAVGLNVCAYLLLTIGWPLLAQTVLQFVHIRVGDDLLLGLVLGLLAISPGIGSYFTLAWLTWSLPTRRPLWLFWISESACILVASTFAALVFWATVLTFDRRLGRVPRGKSRDLRRRARVQDSPPAPDHGDSPVPGRPC